MIQVLLVITGVIPPPVIRCHESRTAFRLQHSEGSDAAEQGDGSGEGSQEGCISRAVSTILKYLSVVPRDRYTLAASCCSAPSPLLCVSCLISYTHLVEQPSWATLMGNLDWQLDHVAQAQLLMLHLVPTSSDRSRIWMVNRPTWQRHNSGCCYLVPRYLLIGRHDAALAVTSNAFVRSC